MAHPGSNPDSVQPGRLGRRVALLKRTGMSLFVAALPAIVLTGLVGITGDSVPPLDWAMTALARPVTDPGGAAWAFHVVTLAGLVGVWFVGFALLIEGYLGLE